jgi:uncharacterized 2Fe-2S/4Fe-4S cluster protein (DUF4445 family)
MEYKIVFQPMGIVGSIKEDETILHAAQRAGIGITAYCGSQKTCGKCRVKIIEGTFQAHDIKSSISNVYPMEGVEKPFFSQEEIAQNYRLSCATKVKGDVVVEIPKESRTSEEVILSQGKDVVIELKPAIKTYYLDLEKATLDNNVDDVTRIKDGLLKKYNDLQDELEIDFYVLKELSSIIRDSNWKINVSILNNKKIIKVDSEEKNSKYGVAIDVGTTTIAAYLCNLNDGTMMHSVSMMNPQICFGDDVLSRVSYCSNMTKGEEELQKILMDGLNELIKQLCEQGNIEAYEIMEAVLVFNTVMEHIALGISPKYLGVSPFISTFSEPVDITARDFGINILPSGNVHCLPSEAGFIGADNVAVLIAEEPYLEEKVKLIIDIGTNSEICLGNKEKLYTTSCATGPALEGAQIQCGMRAAKGAIEAIEINPITLEPQIKIIGGKHAEAPVGICGSGILDAVAQMATTGIIEPNGKFSKVIQSDRVRLSKEGKKEYVLYFKQNESEKDIVVSQKDVRAVQLAKAALYAGAKILMNHYGIETVDEIILAGAFGSYIDKKNALKLGLYPDCHLDRVKVVGNAAGLGARLALLNIDKRNEAKVIARKVEFIETATRLDYQMLFAKAMAIPHETDSFTINQNYKWACQGKDNRVVSDEVIALGMGVFEKMALMENGILAQQKKDKTDYLTFPLIEGVEAIAYGNTPELIGKNYAFSNYIYQSLEEIDRNKSIIESQIIKHTLACIEKHSEEKIVLEVAGPFSILSALIDPINLYKYRRKNKELLFNVLNDIADSLADYTIACIERGVDIISFADTEGAMELVGEAFYKEIVGLTIYHYLKKVSPHLKNALIHLCGKTSYSMQKAGFMIAKVYRVEENKAYMQLLFELANNKKYKFIGHNCIHKQQLDVPIINQLELVNNL